MELLLYNTPSGLRPCYDEDYDEKKKLKIGETYKAKITLVRNAKFHRKYFALIKLAWEYQNERTVAHFRNDVELFRKTVEIAAGHCEPVFNIELKSWVDIPKSIAFDKMDEAAFSDLYERVKDVIFSTFLHNVDEEEFLNKLSGF